MKRVIVRLVNHLSPWRRSGALGAVTCAASANVLSGLGQQINHVIAGTISDCLGAQLLQSRPSLATMSTGGIRCRLHGDRVGCGPHWGRVIDDLYWPRSHMRLKRTAMVLPREKRK